MTRDEVVALLRLRWQTCDQRFSDETADAWHEVLEPVGNAAAFRALHELIRGGATKVALGHLAERCLAQGGVRSTEVEPDRGGGDPVTPERAAQWLRAMRSGIDAMASPSEHEHRRGADHCPVCSKHDRSAHLRDALNPHAMPTCPRCVELARIVLDAAGVATQASFIDDLEEF